MGKGKGDEGGAGDGAKSLQQEGARERRRGKYNVDAVGALGLDSDLELCVAICRAQSKTEFYGKK